MIAADTHIVEVEALKTESAFESLFRMHYSGLCSYANMFLNDLEASEDVVQEVFIKLWNGRADFQIKSSLKSYLFKAVKNACLNLLAHVNIREEYKKHNEALIQEDQSNFTDEAVVSELENKIRLVIDELPTERRKIFILSRFEGLKYKEIAEKLNISVKTVENQMGKALQYLRLNLVDYLPLIMLIFRGLFRDGE